MLLLQVHVACSNFFWVALNLLTFRRCFLYGMFVSSNSINIIWKNWFEMKLLSCERDRSIFHLFYFASSLPPPPSHICQLAFCSLFLMKLPSERGLSHLLSRFLLFKVDWWIRETQFILSYSKTNSAKHLHRVCSTSNLSHFSSARYSFNFNHFVFWKTPFQHYLGSSSLFPFWILNQYKYPFSLYGFCVYILRVHIISY